MVSWRVSGKCDAGQMYVVCDADGMGFGDTVSANILKIQITVLFGALMYWSDVASQSRGTNARPSVSLALPAFFSFSSRR